MTDAKATIQHIIRHPSVIAALFGLGVALVIFAATAVMIWEPAREAASNAEARLEEAAAALRELRYRAQLAENYAARRAQVEALEAKLRQRKSEPEFVRDVEALVATSGATVVQFSSHSAEQSDGVSTTYFEFFLNGSYASLRRFVSELPDLNEFVVIERVSLERNGPAVRAYLVLKRRHSAD